MYVSEKMKNMFDYNPILKPLLDKKKKNNQ